MRVEVVERSDDPVDPQQQSFDAAMQQAEFYLRVPKPVASCSLPNSHHRQSLVGSYQHDPRISRPGLRGSGVNGDGPDLWNSLPQMRGARQGPRHIVKLRIAGMDGSEGHGELVNH